ncbi:hypothetical protein [Tahibacter harae]|uniref:Tissue inhibitor of metalloproteinase n=1 Tax=Tahibacter harae TaxID=2963937 RepID=A0ABT1QUN4_9GAMM|nr:hypothetical protein [Tahibacter harae]MCQ4165995.1 hypothetical protein [Tahibacter harae]
MASIRRVLTSFWLIAAAASGSTGALAGTCRCEPPAQTVDADIAAAAHVFRGVVVGAEIVRTADGFATEIYVGETIPLKGGKPPFYKMVSPLPRACGLNVSVPQEYWFFTNEKGLIAPCSRSGPAAGTDFVALEAQVRDALAASRAGDYDADGYARAPSGLLSVPYLAAGVSIVVFVLVVLGLSWRAARRK